MPMYDLIECSNNFSKDCSVYDNTFKKNQMITKQSLNHLHSNRSSHTKKTPNDGTIDVEVSVTKTFK